MVRSRYPQPVAGIWVLLMDLIQPTHPVPGTGHNANRNTFRAGRVCSVTHRSLMRSYSVLYFLLTSQHAAPRSFFLHTFQTTWIVFIRIINRFALGMNQNPEEKKVAVHMTPSFICWKGWMVCHQWSREDSQASWPPLPIYFLEHPRN